MRLFAFVFGLLGLFTVCAAAWSKEDREIFRIRDELLSHENPDQTFYELLGIKPSASIDDITKAYRKISRSLHPDKVAQQLKAERTKNKKENGDSGSGVNVNKAPSQREINAAIKLAGDRQARLGLVRNILSGPERDRYDYFLKYGFPAWKGTNYYYDRYRPGFGTAVFGVFVFAGGAIHYLALYMSHKKHRDFIERYIKFARDQAWGDNLSIPGIDDSAAPRGGAATNAGNNNNGDEDGDEPPVAQPVNRRQRRMQEAAARKEKSAKGKRGGASSNNNNSGTATPRDSGADQQQQQQSPTGPRKRVIAENGKVLVVDLAGNVYLEEQDEDGNLETFLLDPNELKEPAFKDTAVVRLPVWVFNLTLGRLVGGDGKTKTQTGGGASSGPGAATPQDIDIDSDNDPVHHTPSGGSTDSAEDFELLEKSTDSLGKAKTSGAQAGGSGGGGGGGKAGKRRNKKR